MHNLLPNQERRLLQREYRMRFWTLGCAFLATAIVVGAFSANRYTLPLITEGFFAKLPEATAPEEPSEADTALLVRFKQFKELVGIMDPKKVKTARPVSELMKAVVVEKGSSVHLMSFSALPNTGGKLVLSGVAATREALVAFAAALSHNRIFSSVDLPVSNLSKKTDIDFSMTLTPSGK